MIVTLLVILGYCLARACIYAVFPATTLEDWFARDLVMTVFRLAALAVLVALNRNNREVTFGWWRSGLARTFLWGMPLIGLWMLSYSGGGREAFPPNMIVTGAFTSLVVGIWEEYAFRGLLLSQFHERFSTRGAILISSALFTIFHYQAQSVPAWPKIFLTGVILRVCVYAEPQSPLWGYFTGLLTSCIFFMGGEERAN